MRFSRTAGEGIQALGANKLRTFFMMAGTIVGVAALVVILAMGKGTGARTSARTRETRARTSDTNEKHCNPCKNNEGANETNERSIEVHRR